MNESAEDRRFLKKTKKRKNMTQEQLAEQLGVTRQTVSKWELGETIPDIENMRKMAILFEFSIDKVLGIEVEDDEDNSETFMIAGFIIGSALGLCFDNALLMVHLLNDWFRSKLYY